MDKKVKSVIFGFFCVLFILPGLQKKIDFIHLKPLVGYFIKTKYPELSRKTWVSMEYQNQYEMYLNENIGFRNFFVRFYNQIYFSFFRMAKTREVIVGKNNCLYERNYIEDYLGINFKGKTAIDTELSRAKYLQDTLKKKGIDLLIVFAPGKASFFPENIPAPYNRMEKKISNYDYYTRRCQELGINHIDFDRWFVEQKGKTEFPLYTNCGIHWTHYGMTLATDSMINFIEKLQGIDLPEMEIDGFDLPDTMRDTDNDLANGLNILFDVPHPQTAYPRVRFVVDSTKTRSQVITVADSYYWNIFANGFAGMLFNPNEFWYYNQEIHYSNGDPSRMVADVNLREEIEKSKLIILLSTNANLYKFSFGFIDNVYRLYAKETGPIDPSFVTPEERIQYWENQIRSNPEWMQTVMEKAEEMRIKPDDAIRKDAEYMYKNEPKPE